MQVKSVNILGFLIFGIAIWAPGTAMALNPQPEPPSVERSQKLLIAKSPLLKLYRLPVRR